MRRPNLLHSSMPEIHFRMIISSHVFICLTVLDFGQAIVRLLIQVQYTANAYLNVLLHNNSHSRRRYRWLLIMILVWPQLCNSYGICTKRNFPPPRCLPYRNATVGVMSMILLLCQDGERNVRAIFCPREKIVGSRGSLARRINAF